MDDAPHPWTLHDPGETETPARITDDNGEEVTLQRAWREVSILRTERDALAAERDRYKKALRAYADPDFYYSGVALAALDREPTNEWP